MKVSDATAIAPSLALSSCVKTSTRRDGSTNVVVDLGKALATADTNRLRTVIGSTGERILFALDRPSLASPYRLKMFASPGSLFVVRDSGSQPISEEGGAVIYPGKETFYVYASRSDAEGRPQAVLHVNVQNVPRDVDYPKAGPKQQRAAK